MKNIFCRLLLATAVVSSPLLAADPAVVVQIQSESVQWHAFAEPPRLRQVLSEVAQPQQLYWPAAALFRQSETLNQQQQAFLQQLRRLETHWQMRNESAKVLAVQALGQQVQSWQLAERLPVRVDYDLARIQPSANPRLEQGHYILRVMPRSEHLYFAGAIGEERVLPHQGGTAIQDYLSQLPSLAQSDPSWLYLVQANGELQQLGRAYWNREHAEALPGSLIVFPLHPSILPREFSNLNQELAQLAVHRITP